MTEYCYLKVNVWPVTNDDKKKRGWRKNGAVVTVEQVMASGERVSHELDAVEAVEEGNADFWYPFWESRQAFLVLLNSLAAEGWRVADFTPDTHSMGEHRPWPLGDFLLVRES